MARIVFEVRSKAVQENLLVLTRDGRPLHLQLIEGQASADLPEGGYDLFWSLRGPPGAPFAVTARQGETTLLEAYDAIPAGNLRSAGGAYFGVKGREALRMLKQHRSADVIALHPPVTPVTAKLARGALASGDFAAAE